MALCHLWTGHEFATCSSRALAPSKIVAGDRTFGAALIMKSGFTGHIGDEDETGPDNYEADFINEAPTQAPHRFHLSSCYGRVFVIPGSNTVFTLATLDAILLMHICKPLDAVIQPLQLLSAFLPQLGMCLSSHDGAWNLATLIRCCCCCWCCRSPGADFAMYRTLLPSPAPTGAFAVRPMVSLTPYLCPMMQKPYSHFLDLVISTILPAILLPFVSVYIRTGHAMFAITAQCCLQPDLGAGTIKSLNKNDI